MEKITSVTDQFVVLLKKTRTEDGIRKLLDKFFLARMSEVEQELTEIAVDRKLRAKGSIQ